DYFLGRNQFNVFAAEGMTFTRREIGERHLVRATHSRVQVIHLAGKTIWWKPFGRGVGIQECFVDALGFRMKHTVQPDGTCGHDHSPRWSGDRDWVYATHKTIT